MATMSSRRSSPPENACINCIASSASRKLSLVYLANDVVQQSRARKKDEFPRAFSGIIAEAMEVAYRGTTPDVQNKLRRVTNVWRERGVFEFAVLGDIEQKLEGSSGSKRKW
jgi:regulator of Ty1 transposition protein 103